MQVFAIVNNSGIMRNADVNIKNWFKKVYAIKYLFGVRVIANVNVKDHAMLENIQLMQL